MPRFVKISNNLSCSFKSLQKFPNRCLVTSDDADKLFLL